MSISCWGIHPGVMYGEHWRPLTFDFWCVTNLKEARE
jgi:hypothetical protein